MSEHLDKYHLNDLLNRLALSVGSRIEIGVLVRALDRPAIIPLLLALALMTFIPLACTPAGLLSTLLYWQLLSGKCYLPDRISHWPIPLNRLIAVADKLKWVDKTLGRVIGPYLSLLCHQQTLLKVHCAYGLACAIGTIIPFPGINYFFAPTLALLSLGLYFSNGLIVFISYCLFPLQGVALMKIALSINTWVSSKFS